MSREAMVFVIGMLILLLPALGVPTYWKERGLLFIGALLVWCGYSLRRSSYLREIADETGDLSTDSFSESKSVSHAPTHSVVE